MDPLPHTPRTLKEFVEADLRRAARLIVKVQDEIDPQFRLATPEGDYHLAVTLPKDGYERRAMLRRFTTFMAWKQAASFVLASGLTTPDCVYALGVSVQGEVHACLTPIRREPRPWTPGSFGDVEWLPRTSIGDDMIGLLPRGSRMIDASEMAMLEKWFGRQGRFPAIHVPTGEVRGLG
jgi:hypothetical protein